MSVQNQKDAKEEAPKKPEYPVYSELDLTNRNKSLYLVELPNYLSQYLKDQRPGKQGVGLVKINQKPGNKNPEIFMEFDVRDSLPTNEILVYSVNLEPKGKNRYVFELDTECGFVKLMGKVESSGKLVPFNRVQHNELIRYVQRAKAQTLSNMMKMDAENDETIIPRKEVNIGAKYIPKKENTIQMDPQILVKEVIDLLFRRPGLSLREIAEATDQSESYVKKCIGNKFREDESHRYYLKN